jgi:PKD repeat protein
MKKSLLSLIVLLAMSAGAFAQLTYWTEQNSGLADSRGITDMFAVDANIVWAAAYDGTAPTNACVDFTRTTNGGNTWTAGTITPATGTSIANITAVDGTHAWAITYYPSGSGTKDGVYYTSNGGTTWTQQTTATFSNASSFPDCVHFFDLNNGWCMGDPINGHFEQYTTTDGGTTWTLVAAATNPAPLSGEFGVVGYYSAVGNTIWFGTNMGRIYKSTDKGYTWTVATCTPLNNKYIQPFFKDQDFGLTMDKDNGTTGMLAMSINGGTTWTARNNAGNTFTNDMAYLPGTESSWVTTGADATNGAAGVTYSFDDGATWTDITETIGIQFLATAWVNDSTGWAGSFVASGAGGMYKFNGVLAPPATAFTASDTAIALNQTVTFTDQSTGGATAWLWTFEGGVPATSNVKTPPPILYSTSGAHNVTLKATNIWGAKTLVKTGYIVVGGVGVNEVPASAVTIYPNPVKDVMNINSDYTMQQVQLFNMMGQQVMNQISDSKNLTLNTSNLNAGIYTLKVKVAGGYVNKKVVIE